MEGKKVYVQLAPDADGVASVRYVQSQLPIPRSGRMMPPEEIHMTVIHFGKADDVFADLHRRFGTRREEYDAHLLSFVGKCESLADGSDYVLAPRGFDGLGRNGHTLVVRYDAPTALRDLHTNALDLLRRFFAGCGVPDPDAYMAADPNFKYALTFTPHITLYKGYDGPLPSIALGDITMKLMKFVY